MSPDGSDPEATNVDTDAPTPFGRRIPSSAPKTGFDPGGSPPRPAATAETVLMWLAGAGYRPKEAARARGLVPTAMGAEEAADRLFDVVPPDDPLPAARMRAEILASLHREAPTDPRVRDIVEADPILVADPRTGWLVTETMFQARLALFDAVATLLETPLPDDAATAEMRATLIAAYEHLSPESQREWCYSELRLEQGVLFLETRRPGDLMTLAAMLRPVHEADGPWRSMRLFGLAAAMSDTAEGQAVPVADLLTMADG